MQIFLFCLLLSKRFPHLSFSCGLERLFGEEEGHIVSCAPWEMHLS